MKITLFARTAYSVGEPAFARPVGLLRARRPDLLHDFSFRCSARPSRAEWPGPQPDQAVAGPGCVFRSTDCKA